MIFYIILIVVSIVALVLVNRWEKRCKEEISAKVTVDLDLPGVIEDYNRLLKNRIRQNRQNLNRNRLGLKLQ